MHTFPLVSVLRPFVFPFIRRASIRFFLKMDWSVEDTYSSPRTCSHLAACPGTDAAFTYPHTRAPASLASLCCCYPLSHAVPAVPGLLELVVKQDRTVWEQQVQQPDQQVVQPKESEQSQQFEGQLGFYWLTMSPDPLDRDFQCLSFTISTCSTAEAGKLVAQRARSKFQCSWFQYLGNTHCLFPVLVAAIAFD